MGKLVKGSFFFPVTFHSFKGIYVSLTIFHVTECSAHEFNKINGSRNCEIGIDCSIISPKYYSCAIDI